MWSAQTFFNALSQDIKPLRWLVIAKHRETDPRISSKDQAFPSSYQSLRLTCLLGKSLNKEQVLLPMDHWCCSPSLAYLTLMEPEWRHLHNNKEKDSWPRNDSFIHFSQSSKTCQLNRVLKFAKKSSPATHSFNKSLFSAYYVPGTRDAVVNKRKIPTLTELTLQPLLSGGGSGVPVEIIS